MMSVSMSMHLNGSFVMLLSFIAPPNTCRIHPQLLFRNGSVQVWDWSLPTHHSIGHQTAVRPPSNKSEIVQNKSLWNGIPQHQNTRGTVWHTRTRDVQGEL